MEPGQVVLLGLPATVSKSANLVIHFGVPPIGFVYIAGALKRANIPYTLVDALGEGLDQIRPYKRHKGLVIYGLTFEAMAARLPPNPKYFLIGTNYTPAWYAQADMLRRLKELYPDSLFILGGENSTAYHDKILKFEDCIDICVLGEADETIVSLLDALETGKDLKSIAGIAFRDSDGQVFRTAKPKRIRDLSNLYPDWDQFPLENYLKRKTAVRNYGRRTMPMVASRGCVYQCSFCNSPDKWGTLQVTRSPQEIIAEMRHYKEKYKIDHICIVDLASTSSSKWFIEFCKALIDANLGITWEMSSGTRSENLSYENIELVKKSGNIYLSLSPESGSLKTLIDINKKIDLKHFEQVLKDCFKIGMRTQANFVTGLQHQTKEDINITYKTAMKYAWLGADDISVFSYITFPGTEMYRSMVKSGEIKVDTREEYEAFNYTLAASSIVATHKQSMVIKNYPIHILNQAIMLACFLISLVKKPSRIPLTFWGIVNRKALGVFEVAGYCFLRRPYLLVRMYWLLLTDVLFPLPKPIPARERRQTKIARLFTGC